MASFVMARHDQAVQQFMAAERQAHQEVRDMWHRAHQVADEDMDLLAQVTMGTVCARHQQEA
jgi:outer membrane protein TolC